MPFVVGLTGGIGAGKTTVADKLAALGAEIIDTDVIARELTRAGHPLLGEIAALFGPGALTVEGELDRTGLRARVFANPEDRLRLESLLHPEIRKLVASRLRQATGPYVVLVVPLLVETGAYADVINRVLVVDVAEETQLARVMQRSSLSRAQVQAILQAQASRSQRLARADDVLANEGQVSDLDPAIDTLHRKYLALAGQQA
jgi:dephospho-CoA kinase